MGHHERSTLGATLCIALGLLPCTALALERRRGHGRVMEDEVVARAMHTWWIEDLANLPQESAHHHQEPRTQERDFGASG